MLYENTYAGYTNAKDDLKEILDDLNEENKCLKTNRVFKEYEGWWLEYIPEEPQNKYTIIHFYYDTNEDRYELRGRNYTSEFNSRRCLKFGSDKIIEDKNPQILHYVTDTTIDIATCTGTIIFQKPEEEIVCAEGYYIDVTNAKDDVLIKRKTKMIMFNKAFWVKIGKNSDEWQDDLKYDDILTCAKEAFEQFI